MTSTKVLDYFASLVAAHTVRYEEHVPAVVAVRLVRLRDVGVVDDQRAGEFAAPNDWVAYAPMENPRFAAFASAMDDDLGTPAAVAALFEAIRTGNQAVDAGDREAALSELLAVCSRLDVFGLHPNAPEWADRDAGSDLTPVVDGLVGAQPLRRSGPGARAPRHPPRPNRPRAATPGHASRLQG